MQEGQPSHKNESILQQTQSMSYDFFGLVEIMQTYLNQRIAESMLNIQQQERQLFELKKGQTQEDIKLFQLMSQNQNIAQLIQRQVDSLHEKNSVIYEQNLQTILLFNEDKIDQNQACQRQQVLEQFLSQSMNAIDVSLKIQKQNTIQLEPQRNA